MLLSLVLEPVSRRRVHGKRAYSVCVLFVAVDRKGMKHFSNEILGEFRSGDANLRMRRAW